ncbi:MAG: hypothetical protein AB1916_06225 [Thermodesulfobacteriota bacterium]
MPRVLVHEGSSGIVELNGPGVRETYHPDNDLDRALDLLLRLYELKAANGARFLDNYRREGFNWLSGQVGNLYWRWLFRLVQYGPLLRRFLSGELTPVFRNDVNLAKIWEVLRPRSKRSLSNWWRYQRVLPAHNRKVLRGRAGTMLFYRYGPNDFRTREMVPLFEGKGVDFTYVYSASARVLRDREKLGRPAYFLYRRHAAPRLFAHEYPADGLGPDLAPFLPAVLARCEEHMSFQAFEFRRHLENLGRDKPALFFGLDDHQEVHPILFACKALGIPSIGYQLGMYARRQAAYTLEGWAPGDYQWYDNVIVWGQYWEDVVRRWGRAYPDGYFLPGTNKHGYEYKRLDSPNFNVKNILVPYEFWGDTRRIGQYMMKLMDLGYTVYFKYKPDERPERQIACYCLESGYADRVRHVERITDQLMAEINIVAGGMTTLLYDLLPYGKETWVFDTEFRLLDDMVQDGWARLVRYEDLDSLPEPQRADRDIDREYLSRSEPLASVLERHVLSRL